MSVDIVLDHSGPNHTKCGRDKAQVNLLDWRKVEASLPEGGIDEQIANWYQDNYGERIQVAEDLRRHTSVKHGVGLTGQVVVELVVRDPVKWIPQEDSTCVKATADFVDPCVVKVIHFGRRAGSMLLGFTSSQKCRP